MSGDMVIFNIDDMNRSFEPALALRRAEVNYGN
jgi:hypothetical protein